MSRPRPYLSPTPTRRSLTLLLSSPGLRDPPTMIIVNAYHGPLVGIQDDMVAERAHATQRVHPRDGLMRHLTARRHAYVSRRPRVPGDEPTGRVRAHVREERVGGDVQRLLLLHARVIPAPAVAHDIQHDQPVREIGVEVFPGGGRGGMPVAVSVSASVWRPCMWHRVRRDGKVAGWLGSWCDVWEVQAQDGTARGADVLYYQIRIVRQGFATRIEYVIGVQEFVTERRKVASLEGNISQTKGLNTRKRLNPY